MAKRPIKFLLFPKKLTKTPKSLNSWPTGHFNQNTHVSIYRVIQTSDPPSQAKTGYAYQKLGNAFSNTIYLDIIWKVSCTRIKLLGLSESFCKIDSINFWLIFTIFYQYQVFRLKCLTKSLLIFLGQLWACSQIHGVDTLIKFLQGNLAWWMISNLFSLLT